MNMLPTSVSSLVQMYKSNLEYSEKKQARFMSVLRKAQRRPMPWRFQNVMQFGTVQLLGDVVNGRDVDTAYENYVEFLQNPAHLMSLKTRFLLKASIAEWKQETMGWNDQKNVCEDTFYKGLYDELYYRCPDFRILSCELKCNFLGDFEKVHPMTQMMMQRSEVHLKTEATLFARLRHQPPMLHGLHIQFFICGRNAAL